MRSALHHQFGDPGEVLVAADAPLPEPGPGEVRIRMRLSPVHNHDIWTIRGQYGYKPALPAIGGSEALGVIDALGEGVAHLQPGQRVATASGRGTWAEYFLAPAAGVTPMPDGMPDEAAAQLIAMPLSALMLLESINAQPGQWLVQNAANGAVGKTLAVLAAARGIRVLSLVRRDAGVQELAEAGVGDALSTEQPEWMQAAKALLGKPGAVAAVDSVGGQASAELMALLGHGGKLLCFGAMSGQPMQIPAGDLMFKDITVNAFWARTASAKLGVEEQKRLMGELFQRVMAGELKLPVEATYAIEDVAEAVAASLRPGRGGKVMLRP